MSGGSAGTNFLGPNWPCRSYSFEMQQVIKIYGQIDVHETATKSNADYPPLRAFFTTSSFVVNKSTKPQQGLFFIVHFLQSKAHSLL